MPSTLYYTGIYRFLNNPEITLGFAGYYGLALITGSPAVWVLAFVSHAAHSAFVRYVERPHMARLYGDNMRPEAGTVSAIKDAATKLADKAPGVKSALGAASGAAANFEKNGLTAVDKIMYQIFHAVDYIVPADMKTQPPRRLARAGAADAKKGGKKG